MSAPRPQVLGPGFRLGWVTGPPLLVDKLALASQASCVGPSSLSQVGCWCGRGVADGGALSQALKQVLEGLLVPVQLQAPLVGGIVAMRGPGMCRGMCCMYCFDLVVELFPFTSALPGMGRSLSGNSWRRGALRAGPPTWRACGSSTAAKQQSWQQLQRGTCRGWHAGRAAPPRLACEWHGGDECHDALQHPGMPSTVAQKCACLRALHQASCLDWVG